MIIKNVVIQDVNGEFDFQAEGFEVEIVEVFEDAVSYVSPITDQVVTEDCRFENGSAIIEK